MTVGELKRARSAQPKFFEDNWWIIEDQDLIEFLRVGKFYQYMLDENGMNELFNMTPDDLKEQVSGFTAGQRKSVMFEARNRIKNGRLSDLKMIRAIEEALNVSLIKE